MSLIVNIAAVFSGKKALKEAQKQINVLESSVKKLGTTLGVSLSAAAVVAFGKASVKAFTDDQKAAVRLAGVLDNLGLAFANPQIATFIEDLSRASGVVDDQLRPAFQSLITTTGSLTKSQELLAQAIDISTASGIDLATVSSDLAQAYVGNTRGLRKYNIGLTQAELKASSFADIQKRLTTLFSGANAKYLETYAGKMQLLATRASEAQEVIGQGLVDALIALSGDTSVQDLATDMENAAKYTADTVRGIGLIIAEFKKIPGVGLIGNILKAGLQTSPIVQLIGAAQKKGAAKQSTGFSFFGSPAEQLQKKRDAAAATAAEKAAAKRAKTLASATTKNTAELKKQAALKKASAMFDLEQIQILAALKGNISADERKRLELQLAIVTGNVDEASKLTYQLAISQGLTVKLAQELASLPMANNPFAAWKGYLDDLELQAKRIASLSFGSSARTGFETLTPTVQSLVSGATTGIAGSTSAGDVYITVNGSVLSEQDLISAVQNGLQFNSLAGKPSDIGRLSGMFG